jgi:hypothetical protein
MPQRRKLWFDKSMARCLNDHGGTKSDVRASFSLWCVESKDEITNWWMMIHVVQDKKYKFKSCHNSMDTLRDGHSTALGCRIPMEAQSQLHKWQQTMTCNFHKSKMMHEWKSPRNQQRNMEIKNASGHRNEHVQDQLETWCGNTDQVNVRYLKSNQRTNWLVE